MSGQSDEAVSKPAASMEKLQSNATLRQGLEHVDQQQVKIERKETEEKLEEELEVGFGFCVV